MDTPPSLIAGRYAVDPQPLPSGAGGGLAAFAASDAQNGRAGYVAIQMRRHWPARAGALAALSLPIDHLLYPLAHGVAAAPGGEAGYFIVCPAPPGPSLAQAPHAWSEAALLDLVLRPAAAALEALHEAGVTHRAIRPDNVFQAAPDQPVTLGCAWASPAAALQPVIFEPPASAMCLPAGRGEGSFADDIYALGALLVSLAMGGAVLAGWSDAAILRRKIEHGSFTALVGDQRLPPAIADLARTMLATDPEHRPSAAMLRDPAAARVRRVAARPARRAQRPLEFNGVAVWEARQLAFELATEPAAGLAALRDGSVNHWLRRGLGDVGLASRVEEMLHGHGGGTDDPHAGSLMRLCAIATLDPLAPMCWDGLAILPDGLGSGLAACLDTDAVTVSRIEDLISAEAIGAWGQARADRCDSGLLRLAARQLRAVQRQRPNVRSGMNDDAARLAYHLNPLLPCASPLLAGHLVLHAADLLPALDSSRADPAVTRPLDAQICAFISVRGDRRFESELAGLTSSDGDAAGALAQLQLFARIQAMVSPQPLPQLARWISVRSAALADVWHRRDRRAGAAAALHAVAESGQLGRMLAMIEDPAARAADLRDARLAAAAAAQIDADLLRLRTGGRERAAIAHQIGQEIAAGIGLTLLAGVLTVAALG